jgi:hypothetical protein
LRFHLECLLDMILLAIIYIGPLGMCANSAVFFPVFLLWACVREVLFSNPGLCSVGFGGPGQI